MMNTFLDVTGDLKRSHAEKVKVFAELRTFGNQILGEVKYRI